MKILVSFSGGKDSQACLIQAFKQYGGGNLIAVFCDTGWEHPDTYKHVNDVCLQMGVRLITAQLQISVTYFCSIGLYFLV